MPTHHTHTGQFPAGHHESDASHTSIERTTCFRTFSAKEEVDPRSVAAWKNLKEK